MNVRWGKAVWTRAIGLVAVLAGCPQGQSAPEGSTASECARTQHNSPQPSCELPQAASEMGDECAPSIDSGVYSDGLCFDTTQSLCDRCLTLGWFAWSRCPSYQEYFDALMCKGLTPITDTAGDGTRSIWGGGDYQDQYFDVAYFGDNGELVRIEQQGGMGQTWCCSGNYSGTTAWGIPGVGSGG